MNEGDSFLENLNVFNTVISQLLYVDIKINEEEMYISMLCSFLDSWDRLVVAIGSNNTTLKIDDVVPSLF